MPRINVLLPEYSRHFRCIGPACEDTCCQGWAVGVDQPTFVKYQSLPPGPLRTLIDASVVRTPSENSAAESAAPHPFASVRMLPSHACPFLTEQRLCRIQQECGEKFLCGTCAAFPRIIHRIDGIEEKALTLSCPEAARLVLLTPSLRVERPAPRRLARALAPPTPVRRAPAPAIARTASSQARSAFAWTASPWPIRDHVVALVRNRRYALWQRLFLLGIFCRRLDALARERDPRTLSEFLREFSAAVDAGLLREPMEKIPPNLAVQLELVLLLLRLGVTTVIPTPRLQQCLRAFTAGIGHAPGASAEEQIAAYSAAFTRGYQPFFDRQPHILENYLINEIFRDLFPFGNALLHPDPQAGPASRFDCTRAFSRLAVQFALLKGLLIGVAGHHREAFSAAHVVDTVQIASKHFEHNRKFLEAAHDLVRQRGLDNPSGITTLLRN